VVRLCELAEKDTEMIKNFFRDVFTREPWNDDWSDEIQLQAYIVDLTGNRNSLTFGLFENDTIIGLSIGSVKHWFTGTEYCIDEFCVKTEEQGRGVGSCFIGLIEKELAARGIHHIFLQTNRNLPAYKFYKKNGFDEMVDHVSFSKHIAE